MSILTMKKILIFKTDKIGDLLNISPIINNLKLNFPNSEITLVCSPYNLSIAKHYSLLKNIIIYKKPFFIFLLKNFRNFFFNRYDIIFQLDGKKDSYMSSIFIRSKKKVAIKYIKKKKIFFLNIFNVRPNFFISFFFTFFVKSNEDYLHVANKSFHYLTLYFALLAKLNIKIFSKKHYLPFNPDKPKYSTNYYNIHIDERWLNFNKIFYKKFEKKICILAKNNNLVITSNLGGNKYFDKLSHYYKNINNIYFKNNASIDELINIIYYSHTVISSHSGLTVHVAASFDKNIIDIVLPSDFNELDRWIPFTIKYKRFSINNFLYQKF